MICVAGLVLVLAACETDKEAESNPDHTGEVVTGDEVNTLAMPDTNLVLVDYMHDRQQERIAGSVMNNSSISFVNVQIAFNTFDVEGQMVGTVRDSTSEVQPGDVWQFGIALAPDNAVSRVQPLNVQGTARNMPGGQDILLDPDSALTDPPASQEAIRPPAAQN